MCAILLLSSFACAFVFLNWMLLRSLFVRGIRFHVNGRTAAVQRSMLHEEAICTGILLEIFMRFYSFCHLLCDDDFQIQIEAVHRCIWRFVNRSTSRANKMKRVSIVNKHNNISNNASNTLVFVKLSCKAKTGASMANFSYDNKHLAIISVNYKKNIS